MGYTMVMVIKIRFKNLNLFHFAHLSHFKKIDFDFEKNQINIYFTF
jgi:hypothetical protein